MLLNKMLFWNIGWPTLPRTRLFHLQRSGIYRKGVWVAAEQNAPPPNPSRHGYNSEPTSMSVCKTFLRHWGPHVGFYAAQSWKCPLCFTASNWRGATDQQQLSDIRKEVLISFRQCVYHICWPFFARSPESLPMVELILPSKATYHIQTEQYILVAISYTV